MIIKKKKREIRKIIIHCSDSNWGNVDIINSWHIERGFSKIGYHYLILNGYETYKDLKEKAYKQGVDGLIQVGRSLDEVGAHCEGHNSDSIGICLIGTNAFTPNQLFSLKNLVLTLLKAFNLTPEDVYPHYYFNPNKTCPNFNIKLIWEI